MPKDEAQCSQKAYDAHEEEFEDEETDNKGPGLVPLLGCVLGSSRYPYQDFCEEPSLVLQETELT